MQKKNWYPLDNAAKIYPPNTTEASPFVFSFTARLASEVDPEVLQKAVNLSLEVMPTFKTRLKRGIFWYYLERNNKVATVKPQPAHYLKQITPESNNGYMFEVFYRKNTVTINLHHSLTDGTGGTNFFLEILFEYFKLMGYDVESEGVIRPSAAPHAYEESEDTFRVFDKKLKNNSEKEYSAYKFKGTPFSHDGYGIVCGVCKVDQLKALAKQYGATVTEYLAALYMYVIYETCLQGKPEKNKRVQILVPINLRKRFSSNTVRNFSLFVRLKHDFHNEISFEECIELCKKQLAEGSTTEKIEQLIHSNVKLEKNPFMKIIPLFLKDIAMRLVYRRVGENLQSGDLSNIGLIKTPESFSKYLKDIAFVIGPTASAQQNITVIGYNGKIYISSARGYVETRIERELFKRLAKNGVELTIYSNYWESEV
ncbi:MAG: hypothetical protein IKJ19_04350 [Clostridia bacterium]|nr:hypothetical protein [Clostridia bacterium]